MLYQDKATPAEYWAGLEYAKDRGWLEYHESGTFVRMLDLGPRLVLRDETGWQLTDAGREILSVAESSAPQPVAPEVSAVSAPPQPDALTAPPPRLLERAIPAQRPSRREGRRRNRQRRQLERSA
ncbi:hypothetical protein J2R96_005376 [Bradyrhizobium elkanii]|nr:hypothetical protein [Bradyrhizobium elkanii]